MTKLTIVGSTALLIACLAATWSLAGPATHDDHEAIIGKWARMWNERDPAIADQIAAKDIARFHPRDEVIRNVEGLKQLVADVTATFPDFHVTVEGIEVDERGGTMRWTVSGTHSGPGIGPPTGKRFEVKGSDTFVIEDGKVQMNWAYWDGSEFLGQLGFPMMAPRSYTNVQTFLRWPLEANNKRRPELVDELFAADHVLDENGMRLQGVEGMRAHCSLLQAAFTDFHLTIDDVIGEGDFVAARWTATGVQTGEFLGVPATDKKFEVSGLCHARMKDGKIVETTLSWDTNDLFRQLGATPPNAPGLGR